MSNQQGYLYQDKATGFKTNDIYEYQNYLETQSKFQGIQRKEKGFLKKFFTKNEKPKEEKKMDFICEKNKTNLRENFEESQTISARVPELEKDVTMLKQMFVEINKNIEGMYQTLTSERKQIIPNEIPKQQNKIKFTMIIDEDVSGAFISSLKDGYNCTMESIELIKGEKNE